jgi:hypothetical protein
MSASPAKIPVSGPIDEPALIAESASDLMCVLAIPSRTATYGFPTTITDDLNSDAHGSPTLLTTSVNR